MTRNRIELLLESRATLEPWIGKYSTESLLEWLRAELGDENALDRWVPRGPILTKAVALSPVLHVVGSNTPHAAFQSLFRGLLLGCHNRVKLPGSGLRGFEAWVDQLPDELATLVEVRHDLPENWLRPAAAVIFGTSETLETFRKILAPDIVRLEHGPRIGIAVVFEPGIKAAKRVAADILRYDQRGCLSVQAVYVDARPEEVLRFGDLLADELIQFRKLHPRELPSLSESGAVANAREITRYRQANGDDVKLWESIGTTEWTIGYHADPTLRATPLNGFVHLHPWPRDPARLGDEIRYVSSVSVFPFSAAQADRLEALAPLRICAAGTAQDPTLFWNHDGMMPLATLVRWRDLG